MREINNIKITQQAITTLDTNIPLKPCRVKTNKQLILLLNTSEGVHPLT